MQILIDELIIKLLKTKNQSRRVHYVNKIINKQLCDMGVFYFSFNQYDKILEDKTNNLNRTIIDQTECPVVHCFLSQKTYTIDNITNYFNSLQLIPYRGKQCFLTPVGKIGVMGFYNSNLMFEENIQKTLEQIVNLFLISENNSTLITDLKKQTKEIYDDFLKLRKRDSNIIKSEYFDFAWIDHSGRAKSFKRDTLYYTKTSRLLNITGPLGYGKAYLARVIQGLRSNYGSAPNITDCSTIEDMMQLKIIFGINQKNTNYFNYEHNNTLILENIDCLSCNMLKLLYELICENKQIISNNVKIITTSNDPKFHNECDSEVSHFFSGEKLQLHNRLSSSQGLIAFINSFTNEYYKENLKRVEFSEEDVIILMSKGQGITNISKLKERIFSLCEVTPHGGRINRKFLREESQKTIFGDSTNLTIQVNKFEKSIILKTLVLNNWNREQTARYLKIPRRTLGYKCNKHRIGKDHA